MPTVTSRGDGSHPLPIWARVVLHSNPLLFPSILYKSFKMKKLILSAAFFTLLTAFASAQTTATATSSDQKGTTSEGLIIHAKSETDTKTPARVKNKKRNKKANQDLEQLTQVKISIPLPVIMASDSASFIPKIEN